MRRIFVEPGLHLRFPGRDDEFSEGVEIGILVALMSAAAGEFDHRISTANLDQARALAERMGFRVVVTDQDEATADIRVLSRRSRPRLTLVDVSASPLESSSSD
jgi:hypothetical protein